MKKQILIIMALSLAQGAIAMEPRVLTLNALASHVANAELFTAAVVGDYNKVAKLLSAGADANAKRDYDEPALTAAAGLGHEEVVKLLLENHALVDARDSDGATPLMYASTINIAELLLRAGADINAVDHNGRSVLGHAIEQQPNIIKFLLENGASIDSINQVGYNPVMEAADTGDEELVMLLLTTPNRKMILRALAGLKAIEKSQKPTRDILWLLKKELIAQLVEEQMNRIALATNRTAQADNFTASDIAYLQSHFDLGLLLEPHNPASVARIRQRVEENISRIILLGEPLQRLEPAQGLTQEDVGDIMGSWLPERE